MAARDPNRAHTPRGRLRWRRPIWTLPLAGLVILAIGILIGSRFAGGSDTSPGRSAAAQTRPSAQPARPRATPSVRRSGRSSERSEAGAVAAAAAAVAAFDATVLLDAQRLRATVNAIVRRRARARLLESFQRGATLVRERLAVDSTPAPVFFVRAIPVGYRLERYTTESVTVAVWQVALVGSGATLQPRQSWRTQHVSLLWEDGAWKITGFSLDPGPTPPLAQAEAADAPATLFRAIPAFEPFRRAAP